MEVGLQHALRGLQSAGGPRAGRFGYSLRPHAGHHYLRVK